jgi:uncharacterized membrane protein
MDSLQKSITVNCDIGTVFKIWDNVQNIPKFMKQIKSVKPIGNDMTHWTVRGPFNTMIEWDARILEKKNQEKITWKSTEGDIIAEGEVKFEPEGPEKTRVELDLQYEPKSGLALSIFQSLFGNPDMHVEYSLEKFKEFAEEKYS